MSAYQYIAQSLIAAWNSIEVDRLAACAELDFEHPEHSESFSKKNIVEIASNFDDCWPDCVLASLSSLNALYFAGAHLLLILNWKSVNSSQGSIIPELKSIKDDWSLIVPGQELVAWMYNDKAIKSLSHTDPNVGKAFLIIITLLMSEFDKLRVTEKQIDKFHATYVRLFEICQMSFQVTE